MIFLFRILFQIPRERDQLGIVTIPCQQHCKQTCPHTVNRVKTYVRLLSLFVIPVGTMYYTSCSTCKGLQKIDATRAQELEHQLGT
jgi:hypothetical protein